MNFEGLKSPEMQEEEEVMPTPQEVNKTASDIFEEEREKMESKFGKHARNGAAAAFVAVVATFASMDQPLDNAPIFRQSIEYFGASPEWTAVLNIGLAAYDFSRAEIIGKKLKRLVGLKLETSDATGSQ